MKILASIPNQDNKLHLQILVDGDIFRLASADGLTTYATDPNARDLGEYALQSGAKSVSFNFDLKLMEHRG